MKQVFLSFLLMLLPVVESAAAVGDIFTANTNGFNIRFKIISSTAVMLYGEYSDNTGNDEQDYWVHEWSSCLVDYNKKTVDDDGDVLTYCRYQGSVTIPETILNPNDGHFYAITRIGEYAFGHADGITSVTLPSTITEISAHAFEYCSSLPTINIPESVTTIGDYAFYNSGLSSLDIPDNVSYLGKAVFYNCTSLSSVNIPTGITEIQDYLFAGCSSLTEITIINGITSIGSASFNCTSLSTIIIPETVSTIEEYAFGNCKSLTDVYCLPQEIPTTKINTFASTNLGNATLHVPAALIKYYKLIEPWSDFKKIVASSGALEIDGIYYSLNDDTKTAEVIYGNWDPNEIKDGDGRYTGGVVIPVSVVFGNVSYVVTSIGKYAFKNCSGLTSIEIPTSIETLGQEGLAGCSELENVDIPSSIKTIGPNAFMDCTSLTEIVVPNSVEDMGVGMFIGCKNLRTATLPEGITMIGNSMFAECSSLESFTVPDNVNTIDVAAFSQCTSLKTLNIGKNLTTVGNMAFTDCNSLSTLTMNCSEIKNWFEGITSITNVTIGENVSAISEKAFYGCSNIAEVIIGEGVTTIGIRAFANIENLASVTIKAATPPTTSKSAFEGSYTDYATLYVPSAGLEQYKAKAPWSSFKEILPYDAPVYDQKCEKPAIIIANGLIEFTCETEDVVFHYDISSSVQGEGTGIKLPETFKISVYASKEGYNDSEVEIKEISAPAAGDLNRDGVVDAADVVMLVNSIMDK